MLCQGVYFQPLNVSINTFVQVRISENVNRKLVKNLTVLVLVVTEVDTLKRHVISMFK